MPADDATHIDSTLSETRKFPRRPNSARRAWSNSREEYEALYKRAERIGDCLAASSAGMAI